MSRHQIARALLQIKAFTGWVIYGMPQVPTEEREADQSELHEVHLNKIRFTLRKLCEIFQRTEVVKNESISSG